jgi:hypothetical protein
MVNDKPFYTPTSFVADSASFTYTFPEEEKGTGWHALTLPFKADSVYIDSIPVALDDCLKHFWIYEFSAQSLSGEVIFTPATELRAATPYIIAADSTMAGRSIEFRGVDVPFYKSGSDKMVISSPAFQFHGHTLNTAVSNCYVLNEEGTAFQYTITKSTLTPLTSYFTTNLSEESRPASIVLPDLEQLKALLAEQEDAITSVYTTIQKTGVVYDLKGRMVDSQSKKGLYIVDGKKILKK